MLKHNLVYKNIYIIEISHLDKPLTHNSIIDELFFWIIKFQFSQSLVTFVLSLLPNEKYKVSSIVFFFFCKKNFQEKFIFAVFILKFWFVLLCYLFIESLIRFDLKEYLV